MKKAFEIGGRTPRITNTLITSPKVIDRLTKGVEVQESKFPQFHGVKLEASIYCQENHGYLYDENGEMSIIIFEGLE